MFSFVIKDMWEKWYVGGNMKLQDGSSQVVIQGIKGKQILFSLSKP